MIQEILASDIKKLMEHVVVIVKTNVTSMQDSLANGDSIDNVIVAKLDGKIYAIGNLEALEAYRAFKAKKIPCVIKTAKSKMHLLKMHLKCYKFSSTYNPVRMMKIAKMLAESGEDIDVIPSEYRGSVKLKISDDALNLLDQFVQDMAKVRDEVPSLAHILSALSTIVKSKQAEAVKKIIKYTNIKKASTPPDRIVVQRIVGQYPSAESGRRVSMPSVPTEPKEKGEDTADLKVESGGSLIKSHVEEIPDTMLHKCKCGQQHTINLKTGVIREISEDNSKIVVGDVVEGKSQFMVGEDIADMLELELSPLIHAYPIGGKDVHSVLLSRRRIPKTKVSEIGKTINRRS